MCGTAAAGAAARPPEQRSSIDQGCARDTSALRKRTCGRRLTTARQVDGRRQAQRRRRRHLRRDLHRVNSGPRLAYHVTAPHLPLTAGPIALPSRRAAARPQLLPVSRFRGARLRLAGGAQVRDKARQDFWSSHTCENGKPAGGKAPGGGSGMLPPVSCGCGVCAPLTPADGCCGSGCASGGRSRCHGGGALFAADPGAAATAAAAAGAAADSPPMSSALKLTSTASASASAPVRYASACRLQSSDDGRHTA